MNCVDRMRRIGCNGVIGYLFLLIEFKFLNIKLFDVYFY